MKLNKNKIRPVLDILAFILVIDLICITFNLLYQFISHKLYETDIGRIFTILGISIIILEPVFLITMAATERYLDINKFIDSIIILISAINSIFLVLLLVYTYSVVLSISVPIVFIIEDIICVLTSVPIFIFDQI